MLTEETRPKRKQLSHNKISIFQCFNVHTFSKQDSHCVAFNAFKSCNRSVLCKYVNAQVRTGLRQSQQKNEIAEQKKKKDKLNIFNQQYQSYLVEGDTK